MKKYTFIAAGGAVGALLRFELKSSPSLFQSADQLINLALTILVINLIGCLLLGMLNAVFSKTERISTDVKLGLTAGLLGAFTTYSTFCKESLNILDAGYLRFFCYYVAASITLGVGAVYLGHLIGHHILHPAGKNLVARFSIDTN
ncbi:CrcB family protein [Acetobacterium sp.]|uniref:fluoride efflux transporter FluC n=1 Tax=Acetobacterium sp. TaxID=1872094 RepID=UPI0035944E24